MRNSLVVLVAGFALVSCDRPAFIDFLRYCIMLSTESYAPSASE